MRPQRIVYLGPFEDAPREASMRFRLTYDGELQATQGEPRMGQVVPFKLAAHKHSIGDVTLAIPRHIGMIRGGIFA